MDLATFNSVAMRAKAQPCERRTMKRSIISSSLQFIMVDQFLIMRMLVHTLPSKSGTTRTE